MIDSTLFYVLSFSAAMLSVALAVTAYEFRQMSNRRNRPALQMAAEMSPPRVRTWRPR